MYTYERGSVGNGGDNLQKRQWEAAGTGNLFDPDQLKSDMRQRLNTATTGNSYGIGSSPGAKHLRSFEVVSDTFIYGAGGTVSCVFLQGCKVFCNHSDRLSVVNCFNCWKYLQTEKIHLRKGSHQWVSVGSLLSLIDKFYWQGFFIESRDKLSFPGCTILR